MRPACAQGRLLWHALLISWDGMCRRERELTSAICACSAPRSSSNALCSRRVAAESTACRHHQQYNAHDLVRK